MVKVRINNSYNCSLDNAIGSGCGTANFIASGHGPSPPRHIWSNLIFHALNTLSLDKPSTGWIPWNW